MNLLPALSSTSFSGLTRHTTLILHSSLALGGPSSAILKAYLHKIENKNRLSSTNLESDRLHCHTVALTRPVYMKLKRPVVHSCPPKSATTSSDVPFFLWTSYQIKGKSIIASVSQFSTSCKFSPKIHSSSILDLVEMNCG